MKNLIYALSAGFATMLAVNACSDWTKPESIDFEPGGIEGSDKGDEYYAALREWKASRTYDEDGAPNRGVSFGWFSDWTGVGTNMANQLMGLPDSVDFVSMWGNWHSLSPEKKEDLRKVQQIKGTKVLMCFIIDNIGAQTTPKSVSEDFLVDGKKYDTLEEAMKAFWGWYGDPADTDGMDKAIRKYARSILDTIRVYNWDGFDLDLEPHYGSPGNIASYPDRLSILLDEFSKELGPKSGTGKMLCVDGEPDKLNAKDGHLLDFFICQAYQDLSPSYLVDSRISSLVNNFKSELSVAEIVGKTILTSNFESYGATGGPTFTMRNGEQTFQLNAYAQYTYLDGEKEYNIGGIGAFRLVFDKDYTHYRTAMRTMHSKRK